MRGAVFLVVADASGAVQTRWTEEEAEEQGMQEAYQQARKISLESIVRVKGVVRQREERHINPDLPLGHLEVAISELSIVNEAVSPLPISLENEEETEEVRLRHRYLDLRSNRMQKRIRLRSHIAQLLHQALWEDGFVHVETPILCRSSPEGAHEFLVPAEEGKAYALAQSPQQYKQMLIAGGIDKYFQFAKCFRDESGRADRQPEFTQLDIEMGFSDEQQVMHLTESLLRLVWNTVFNQTIPSIQRMTYDEAMATYGTDKPDTRYALTLKQVHLEEAPRLCGIRMPQGMKLTSAKRKRLRAVAAEYGLVFVPLRGQPWTIPHCPEMDDTMSASVQEQLEAHDGDVLILGKQDQDEACLGHMRVVAIQALEEAGLIAPLREHAFLWVTDFPLFEEEDGRVQSVHHPFTAPQGALTDDPLILRSRAYDIVLNGVELGGGSVRIHKADEQRYVLERILRIPHKEVEDHFGHLLNALSSGCPPHAGIALGFDRLLAIITKSDSIRDVIAFPKSAAGRDLLLHCPS